MTALTDADLDRLEALAKSAQMHFDWTRQPHAHFAESANPSTVLALSTLARRARRMEDVAKAKINDPTYAVREFARAILSEPGA